MEKLSAFVTSSNVLRFIVNGTIVSSLDIANLATDWHDLTISYNQSTITIVLDKTIVRQVNLAVDLTASITYIGCIKVSGTAVNHLEGLIEMFAYSDISLVEADIKTLQENGKAIIARTKYDALGRNVEKQILVGDNELKTQYSYLSTTGNNTTTLVETETLPNGNIITYDYDNSNNIKSKVETTATGTFVSKVEYVYDELDRLLTEITYSSSKTITESFTYDQNNNIDTHQIVDDDITTVNEQYIYDTVVKDRLKSIKDLLQDTTVMSLEYEDAYKGNPTKIIKDGVTNTLVWQGRRLTNLNDNSYFYDENGIRIKKITANDTTLYDLEGDRVIGLTKNIFYGDSVKLAFHYNEANQLVGLSMNGEEYFYERDITGNINKIIVKDNVIMVKYTYDAWGNPKIIDEAQTTISSILATHNPFLYKGYIYDAETGYYYLKTRYYDPEIGRFINAKDVREIIPTSINGANLYTYSVNNPVMVSANTEKVAQVYGISVAGLVVSNGGGNSDDSAIKDNRFKIFSAQLRKSTGWQTDSRMISGWLGRVGFSSYTTTTKGDSGLFYAFAGQTADVTNIFGSTYYAGVGINVWNVVGLEVQLETVGLGLSISLFDYSLSLNVNALGSTSLTVAHTKQISEGVTKTEGVTIGANTALVVYTAYWLYKLFRSGDPSWDYQPAY